MNRIFLSAAALFALPAIVLADDRRLPEELVVSGYRPTTTQEVDTSISLLDAGVVERATLSSFEQIVQLVPNMNLSGEASRARYFQLRGIGEREQYEGAPNPSVGFLVDDIDLSGIGGVAATYDIGQIEVLRGPQSARYGSSALAGMVYIQTAQPTDEFELTAELGAGNADTRIIGTAIGGGLSENLSARFVAYGYRDNGFRDNVYLVRDDTNERDERTFRAKLNWRFGGGWNALLTGFAADIRNGYDAWSLDNSEITLSDKPGRDEQKTRAASLRIAGPLSDAIEFVSISTAADSDSVFNFDADWANPTTFLPDYQVDYSSNNDRERRTISQEFRLVSGDEGRLFNDTTDWVLGIYAQRLKEDDQLRDPGDFVDFLFCPAPGSCAGLREVTSAYEADTLALFGGLDTRLSERLSLSVGLRVERWDAAYTDRWFDNNLFDVNFNPIPVDGNNRFDPDETMLGGHAALNYDFSDSVRGYARIARGFKAGGFNPSLAAFVRAGVTGPYGAELIPYEPEYLWNYELGAKGSWLNGSLDADFAVFYMDRDDAQLSQSDQLDNPASFIYVTSNGKARSYGLEADVRWQIGERLTLHGALGLLDSKIKEWAVRPAVEGRELAHAPGYTANIGATWETASGWYARADIRSVDEYNFDISHDQKSKKYRTVNLSLGKDWRNWTVALWGRNIFDRRYATRGFFFSNEPPYTQPPVLYTKFGDPRQIGLTLKYRY